MNNNINGEEKVDELIWMGLALAIKRLQRQAVSVNIVSSLDTCLPSEANYQSERQSHYSFERSPPGYRSPSTRIAM